MQNTLKTRETRQQEIAQQFPYEPIQQPKQSFWMHDITRSEKPGELEKVALLFFGFIAVLGVIFYYTSGK